VKAKASVHLNSGRRWTPEAKARLSKSMTKVWKNRRKGVLAA
jgi:hypothetical protein